jgi:hypothetical protein
LWWRPSDARLAGCGLAAAVACSGVWGGGFKALAGGPSACCGLGYTVPRSGSVGLVGGGQHLFMFRGSGDHMTQPILVQTFLEGCSLVSGELGCSVCPAKGGVDTVHTYVCFKERVRARLTHLAPGRVMSGWGVVQSKRVSEGALSEQRLQQSEASNLWRHRGQNGWTDGPNV